ncbi:hypothetical protein BZF66_05860 [Salmonella enterica]|uniref:hypothetical protein n=1 Tax=Salmonella enterica TaxID=28901 RepID=UPI000FDF6861|nr:hypothetical protein CPT_Munch_010 [Salmonella phage Munch]EAR2661085.1 hypothetical protein [Salmonella enterica]ECV9083951.1 hypothetical protein [Salmonella enterica subsp. enterica serovar Infantis]MCP0435954.1 hypothetical protein [Salmonella enterica subsp. enterica serovar Mbandaka]EAZ2022818.1 hypothetical protein [Salmonella enterica]
MAKYCRECGAMCEVDVYGVSNHIYENGDIHHTLDGDHVAIPEIEETLVNEEIFDFCQDHYATFGSYPMECELSNGDVYSFDEMMTVLSEEQKQEIEK